MEVDTVTMAGVQPIQNYYSMYSNPNNLSHGGFAYNLASGSMPTHYNTTTAGRTWIKELQSHVSTGAFHNSGERYDAPKCHPETRTIVIEEIMEWARNPEPTEQFLWIYGPAGSGKSSIAQTVAELCEKEGILASDYFFSRTALGRNREHNLVTTLACQLITTIPAICPYMAVAINDDPLLFSRSLSSQLSTLILDPLAQLLASTQDKLHIQTQLRPYPYVIIIDGLDECGKPESQRYILSAIDSALQKSAVRLSFIISSRPEQVIRDAFNGDMSPRTRRIVLDDKYLPDKDIEKMLESEFLNIRQTHKLSAQIPSDWPSSSDIQYLVAKASGQFIYASTVLKFVGSPRHRPTERLKIVQNVSPRGTNVPFAELDELYKAVLSSVDPSTLEKALDIFSFILANAEIENFGLPLYGARNIEILLEYEPGDIELTLSDLHSIIDANTIGELTLFHASLGDFFRDRSRSGSFYIDMGSYSVKLARSCLRHTVRIIEEEKGPSPDDEPWPFNPVLSFSSRAFVQMFAFANPDDMLLNDLALFPMNEFLKSLYGYFPMHRYLDTLLDWIYRQDIDIYLHLSAQYDHYLTGILSNWIHYFGLGRSDTCVTDYCSFTALTLHVSHDYSSVFSFFERKLNWRASFKSQPSSVHQNRLWGMLFCDSGRRDCSKIGNCAGRAVKIVTEKDPYCRSWLVTSRYVELAIWLLEIFQQCPKGQELPEQIDYETIGLDLLNATLKRAPKEPSIVQYLANDQEKKFMYFNEETAKHKLHVLLEDYIQVIPSIENFNFYWSWLNKTIRGLTNEISAIQFTGLHWVYTLTVTGFYPAKTGLSSPAKP